MPVMEKLKMFVVQEPVVAASCIIAGVDAIHLRSPLGQIVSGMDEQFGTISCPYEELWMHVKLQLVGRKLERLLLPAVVRPMLDSFESSKQVPQPALSDLGDIACSAIRMRSLMLAYASWTLEPISFLIQSIPPAHVCQRTKMVMIVEDMELC
ncbi:hypothetical protein LguiB_010756 [Lonicera macranthoides]